MRKVNNNDLDTNNLYGYALLEPLPMGNFRFLDDPESFDVNAVDCDGAKGYILEVDLKDPDKLHDVHNDWNLWKINYCLKLTIN